MKKIILSMCLLSTFEVGYVNAQVSPATQADLLQQLQAMQQSIKSLQAVVQSQSVKIKELESQTTKTQVNSQVTTVQNSTKPKLSPSFNPEIGFIGDFVFNSTESDEDEEGNDRLSVRELELVLGHDVDPYTRFDSTITFSDFEDVAVEEAYITYMNLPWDTKLRFGRMRPKISKASAKHRDSLPTTTEPLMIQEYFGVEGLYKTAIEFSNFLPLPWEKVTHELILGAMEGGIGEDGTLFGETRRRPSFYARLRNFWEINDTTNADLSFAYLKGSSDQDSKYEVSAYGLDAGFTHYFNPVNRLKIEAEALFQDRSAAFVSLEEEPAVAAAEDEVSEPLFRNSPWGMYVYADLKLAERWSAGLRWDYVEPINYSAETTSRATQGFSPYVSFYQSEFARWRLQYERVDFAETGHDNRFFLQGTFAIGTHKHNLE